MINWVMVLSVLKRTVFSNTNNLTERRRWAVEADSHGASDAPAA